MVKLSIIIPYFETLELTQKLMRNLTIQYKETEIILIDDGCNEKELDRWNSYNNVKVIHQKNMGVAKTRNKGINLAEGEYIAFIDCDDMIMPYYIEALLKAIDEFGADVINFNWYDLTTHQEHRKPHNYAPWKAIYKKDKMPIFREDMEYGSEDVVFQKEIDSGKYVIVYLDKILYLYNSNREGSLMWKKLHRKE